MCDRSGAAVFHARGTCIEAAQRQYQRLAGAARAAKERAWLIYAPPFDVMPKSCRLFGPVSCVRAKA
ncbi:protein of unknown function [Methylocella tundrae]|uniref:Uncharacterized protein n=1 Tax=Methylocella tundrae TaxID=227605 RepID=A0A4U8Z566_METTU|nr:protein of unknown function [Methylocella tundrae]